MMKIAIALHSATGNTRLVARHARDHLVRRGHDCLLHDIVRAEEPLDVEAFDLLGLACPTMYFRPTQVMERFVARLPAAATPRPVFLLATAGGDPGAHFAILAEMLAHKDMLTLGAHLEPFPDSWPAHRAAVARLAWAEPLAAAAARRLGGREALSLLWPDIGDVGERAPARVEAFVDEMVAQAERLGQGGQVARPRPSELHRGGAKLFALFGRVIGRAEMERVTSISIDPSLCSRCGSCALTCPVGCIRQGSPEQVPDVDAGCTGCWACFNGCPAGAISGVGAAAGAGRYKGPSQRARALFRSA